MERPLIHPVSSAVLSRLFSEEPHALLVSVREGIGLFTIVNSYVTAAGVEVDYVLPEKDDKIDIEKGSITVESIRRLYDRTKTVTPKGRLIVIDYVERMAPAAQNAFLKLLEEPNASTRFVLLTHQPSLLLPTVRSRVQQVELRPISSEASAGLLDSLGVTDATKRAQLLFIASGLPAELTRLAQDDKRFESRVGIVRDAREYIGGGAYERLKLAKKYKDSRADAVTLLEDAMKQLTQTVAKSPSKQSLALLERLEVLHKRISEQGNVRLQLSAGVMVQ